MTCKCDKCGKEVPAEAEYNYRFPKSWEVIKGQDVCDECLKKIGF